MSIYDTIMNNGKDDYPIHRIHKEEDVLYCLALKYQQQVFQLARHYDGLLQQTLFEFDRLH